MKFRYLWNACQSNFLNSVIRILKEHPKEFDLTEDEGICFFYALKHNNIEMLTSLLDYYNQKELEGRDYDSMEYKVSKMKLRDTLKENSDHPLVKLSPEIKEIIKPYVESQCSEVGEDDLTLPDFYDEDGGMCLRGSEESAHRSDDILTMTKANLDLLGRVSCGDSSEEGL